MPANPQPHEPIHDALRERLSTLSVVSTLAVAMSATATGYRRTDLGSFLEDRFAPGMEVRPIGFASNPRATISSVTDKELVVWQSRTVEASGAGRRLVVELPEIVDEENGPAFTPDKRRPFVETEYVPGPEAVAELGDDSPPVRLRPVYVVRIYVPEGTGRSAGERYADAIRSLYPSGLEIYASGGTIVEVRDDPAPFISPRLPHASAGYWCLPVNIPLWTLN